MKFFHLSVRLTNEKPDAFVCPFDKPIKSLYFRSFVVSVLFARFHFKVIRKSLYTVNPLLCSKKMLDSPYNLFCLVSRGNFHIKAGVNLDLFFHTFSSNKLVKEKTEQKIKIIASARQDTLKRKTLFFCALHTRNFHYPV